MGRRILLTDAQERAVLASLRCLSADGFELTAVGTSRAAPGLWSRAAGARRLAPDSRSDLEGFLTRIEALLRERRHELLLAGTDASLLTLSRYRALFTPHVELGLPRHEVIARALDKRRVAQAAARVGLAAPTERVCADLDSALAAAAEFAFPVAVKPIETVVEIGGIARRRASRLVADQRALAHAVGAFGACIVQRWARGDVVSIGGVATGDGLLAHVASRYIRMWPAAGGNVAFSETIEVPAQLLERVGALTGLLEWRGLFELELIECGPERYAAIDFNPRAYGSLGLARSAGVPLAALWCGWVLGERPRRRYQARPGARYRWEDADLRWMLHALRERKLGAALAAALPRRDVTHAYFSAGDPAPSVARPLQAIGIAARKRRTLSRGSAAPRRS